MRILALETTEMIGSVAAANDDNLLEELDLDRHLRSAQSLAPAVKTLLERAGWRPTDVELVAVTVGPGSFTGLRVGVTAAKTFAYAVQADILGFSTLETIAAGAAADVQAVWVAIDAQRGEVVAGEYRRGPQGWFEPVGQPELVDAEAWLGSLPVGSVVCGPVLRKLAPRVPAGIVMLDRDYWPPRASAVARLAARYYAAGRRDDLWTLVPRYCRRSAAEEKWEKKEGIGD